MLAVAFLSTAWYWTSMRLTGFEVRAAAEGAFWKANLGASLAGYRRLLGWGPTSAEALSGLRDVYLMALESPKLRETHLRLSQEEVARRCGEVIARQVQESPLSLETWSGVADFFEVLKPENQRHRVYSLENLSVGASKNLEVEDLLEIRGLETSLEVDPNAAYQREALGSLAWGLGLKDLAMQQYLEVMTLLPDLGRHPFLNEGKVNKEIADLVVEGMKRAVQPPRNADPETVYFNLGIFLADQERFAEARLAFEQAQGASGRGYFKWQAYTESRQGHLDEAIVLYRKALLADPLEPPDRVHVLLSLGQLLEEKGRSREAAEAVRSALVLEPRNPRGILLLAQVSEAMGLWGEAEELYVRSSEIGPDRLQTLADLVAFYRRTGRLSLALIPARKLLELQPEDPLYRKQLDDLQEEVEGRQP
ncbi:MAG: hypothetical protein DMH00_01450 [Acidobacteria bacterium]|nr:MAG: hypothetical protein DMH00_01450 [Acidobacteriota bacterium]